MAGIAILSDILKKKATLSQCLHSYSSFSAKVAASASIAAAAASSKPFACRTLFGNGGNFPQLAYCDASAAGAATLSTEDYISKIGSISESILQHEPEQHMQKEPLLMRLMDVVDENSDDDSASLPDNQEEEKIDLVEPLKKSVRQIILEISCITTRRVLERVVVNYVSRRTAWKLLKDASKSTMRKAQRGIPTFVYIFKVGRTTFRANLLAIASRWLIDVVAETCKFFSPVTMTDIVAGRLERKETEAKHLGKKLIGATIKGIASLVFATIGAAIFATIFRPSIGQWIGCVLGDLAGPFIVVYVLVKSKLWF